MFSIILKELRTNLNQCPPFNDKYRLKMQDIRRASPPRCIILDFEEDEMEAIKRGPKLL
jgi:hypothetical protein